QQALDSGIVTPDEFKLESNANDSDATASGTTAGSTATGTSHSWDTSNAEDVTPSEPILLGDGTMPQTEASTENTAEKQENSTEDNPESNESKENN
ncbi:MAG: hypothetical protein IJ828_07655, partial [Treponema sp.]|nr:hypothetical protein [Treponema sp.]